MNWLSIVLFAMVIVCGAVGYFKGLIRTVVTLAIMIASVVITAVLSPVISSAVVKNDAVYDKVYEAVKNGVTSNDEYKELKEKYNNLNTETISSKANEGIGMVDDFVETLNVPKQMKESISEAVKDKNVEAVTIDDITDVACDCITIRIINSTVYILVFLCVTVIAYLVLYLVIGISKLPVIREFDSIAGMAAGIALGVCLIAIAMVVITSFGNTAFGKNAMDCINENEILSWIYDYNPLWKVL